jgi:hypothetical protein
MREASAAEEAEMRAAGWDIEDTKLGPVEERYVQPSLVRDDAAHAATLREAADIAGRVEQFNAGAHHVRPPPALFVRACAGMLRCSCIAKLGDIGCLDDCIRNPPPLLVSTQWQRAWLRWRRSWTRRLCWTGPTAARARPTPRPAR